MDAAIFVEFQHILDSLIDSIIAELLKPFPHLRDHYTPAVLYPVFQTESAEADRFIENIRNAMKLHHPDMVDEQLGEMAVQLLLDSSIPDAPGGSRSWVINKLRLDMIGMLVKRYPSPLLARYLAQRLESIAQAPFREEKRIGYEQTEYTQLVARNTEFGDVLGTLLQVSVDFTEITDLIRLVITGLYDREISADKVEHNWYNHSRTIYSLFEYTLFGYFPRLMERLAEAGKFDYETFQKSVQHLPGLLNNLTLEEVPRGLQWVEVNDTFLQKLREYIARLALEIASNLTDANYRVLKSINLKGPQWLLYAAENHHRLRLNRLVMAQSETRAGVDTAVVHLARTRWDGPLAGAERDEYVARLHQMPAATLQYLLPLARDGREEICLALGWDHAIPLVHFITEAQSRLPASSPFYFDEQAFLNGTGTSTDPALGVADIEMMEGMIASAGETLVRSIVELFSKAKVGFNDRLMMIEAYMGWNAEEIEKKFRKRNQFAVRMYGLLPIEHGDDGVTERYLLLQNFLKQSKAFGAQRSANERAAVEAAMTNLARRAGYSDALTLEWMMEARSGGGGDSSVQSWLVDDYKIAIRLEEATPQLTVTHNGKQLKSAPPAIRKSVQYGDAKKAMAMLREQSSRMRASLEMQMVMRSSIPDDVIRTLLAHPMFASYLSRLILRSDTGQLVMCDAEHHETYGVDGTRYSLQENYVVAHCHDLFCAEELAAWQEEIVRRRIHQPFKQAFRELYLLTPAEQETATYSNRFAGHVVNQGTTARLLQSRGWVVTSGDVPTVSRKFHREGFEAFFDFPDVASYFGALDTATTDQIYFQPLSRNFSDYHRRIPLEEIPPVIFSEVMRDADLVVSVAQQAGEAQLSNEAYQRRGDVVVALLKELRFSNVTIDGHFARVVGKLASYRVHLGSAAIHIEPGNYLCIVPDRATASRQKLFLPFADEGDMKISEVVSKVIMLANDQLITDESILVQIRQAQQWRNDNQ